MWYQNIHVSLHKFAINDKKVWFSICATCKLSVFCSLHVVRFKIRVPDPDLPTIPIFSLGRTSKDTPFRARGRFSLYLSFTCLNMSVPSSGQSAGGWFFLSTSRPSDSASYHNMVVQKKTDHLSTIFDFTIHVHVFIDTVTYLNLRAITVKKIFCKKQIFT